MRACVLFVLLVVTANTGRGHDLSEEVDELAERLDRVETAQTRFFSLLKDFLLNSSDLEDAPRNKDEPRNCLEAKQTHPDSGVQTIRVSDHNVRVYCDQHTDGGGWTVIQRRMDGSLDFNRSWAEYERGFGNVSPEFWLGLRNIHSLTTSGNYSLRVDLWDHSGTHVFAQYSWFYIAGSSDNYRLHMGPYVGGTAGDSMVNPGSAGAVANNMTFTTYDRDNDLYTANCAVNSYGGWWYNRCQRSKLNGRYYADGRQTATGINWYNYKNDWRSFTRAEMKVRPVNH